MYITVELPMTTIKIESKIKTVCKYAASYCNVNFVTLQLVCLWHLFLLHQQECSQFQTMRKSHKTKMQCTLYGGWAHSYLYYRS